jgi:hypothetical protein
MLCNLQWNLIEWICSFFFLSLPSSSKDLDRPCLLSENNQHLPNFLLTDLTLGKIWTVFLNLFAERLSYSLLRASPVQIRFAGLKGNNPRMRSSNLHWQFFVELGLRQTFVHPIQLPIEVGVHSMEFLLTAFERPTMSHCDNPEITPMKHLGTK